MDDLLKEAYIALIHVARAREVTYYDDFAEAIGLERGWGDRNQVYKLLDEVNEREAAAGRPLLSVVVVKKDCDVAGQGFFNNARQLGRYHGDDSVVEKMRFFVYELSAVYDYRSRH